MDTREIARIVASNTAIIDLPMWLRSEPLVPPLVVVLYFVFTRLLLVSRLYV